MDGLFLRQVWAGNDALLETLARATAVGRAGAAAADALHYFLINKGPWSRLDHNEPFIPGVPAKPEAANFYPAGATKDEVEKWLDSLTGDARRRRPPASSRPSAAAPTAASSPCRTASSTRASSRAPRRSCAKPRS